MNRWFAIEYMCSHNMCNDPLILLELFIKLLDRMHCKIEPLHFSLIVQSVTLIRQIGVNCLILVGYNTAVTNLKDTVTL